MKILIPTAKELNLKAKEVDKGVISSKTKEIIDECARKNITELGKIYKISSEKAELELKRWKDLANNKVVDYVALELFNGLMYRNIDRKSFTVEDRKYIRENIYITSSLYGVINALDSISAHRLDFLQNIKINNQSLKNYWKDDYNRSVSNEDLIISLLSSEFEEVFTKDVRDKFVKINFMEEKEGVYKTHSTISKKARGKFLTQLIKGKVNSIDELKNIEFDNFKYQENLSKDKLLVFVAKR